MKRNINIYSREEMFEMNVETLKSRGVTVEDIAKIAFRQQSRFTSDISMSDCIESVEKILTYRDIFHMLQLGVQIDILTEKKAFEGPIQGVLESDLGVFGVDELFGIEIAGMYGTIGKTNFGEIDVNKPMIIKKLNKKRAGVCHTFLDDIVGAIAAGASTRVAQITNEANADKDPNVEVIQLDI